MQASDEYQVRPKDRLPWLESADDDWREGPSWQRVAALVGLGLLILAVAIYGIYWYRNRQEPVGTGALIAAPEGDYKVKPDEPGGMKVEGEGDAALATSQGKADRGAAIDLNSAPETPVVGRRAAAGHAPTLGETRGMAVPASGGTLTAARPGAARAANAVAGSGGALVQLGSFPTEAAANADWAARSKRFAYLAPLGKSVERADVNGRTVYRLRVNAGSAGAAATLCGKLKVAGEACFIPS